ncbi:unnamed protein product [Toxocara canis]|uniref:Uncharacterized protein n=1 Tax=Toxocara canis TaxID=6265 RepID=A0A183U820_TOXCA|nr:unnamed protein product [Toxocara canis]
MLLEKVNRKKFGTFLKLASPSLFDSSKRVINDDFEYFHQQLLAATPQTEYEEVSAIISVTISN